MLKFTAQSNNVSYEIELERSIPSMMSQSIDNIESAK